MSDAAFENRNIFEGIERRKFARIANNFLMRCRPADRETAYDQEKIACIVRDINVAGLAFLSTQECVSGSRLEIELELLGLKEVPASGASGLLNGCAITAIAITARSEEIASGLYLTGVVFELLEKEELVLLEKAIALEQKIDFLEKI